ncbi:hypothetical protein Tco_0033782 [Tanacetum coccineum]
MSYDKELAIPEQTATGLAIPGQTATGKESSNPFMAGSLPKTIHFCDSLQSDEDNLSTAAERFSEDASKQGRIHDAYATVTKEQKVDDDKETTQEVRKSEPAQNTMYCHSEVFLKLQQSEAEAKNEMNKPNGDTGPKQMRSPKVSVSDQALLE